MDINEMAALLQKPGIKAVLRRLIADEMPSGVVVGTATDVKPKGYRKTSAPAHFWVKE